MMTLVTEFVAYQVKSVDGRVWFEFATKEKAEKFAAFKTGLIVKKITQKSLSVI